MQAKRKNDGRKLDHKTLEELRKRAVQSVLNGQSPEVVIDSLGMNRRNIYRWLTAYHEGGWEALGAKKLLGRPPTLTAKQLGWLSKTIQEKNPLQLKFEFALWTVEIVKELIARQFGIQLSMSSVNRILKTLGFTVQRPLYRAWQQDPIIVEKWLKTEFPRLKRRAKKENAEIFFGDEAGIRSDHHAGTTWAKQGETPLVEVTGRRFGLNMISAVSSRGQLRFMVVKGSVKVKEFCDFIDRLIKNHSKKIFLILDRHPIHRSKVLREKLLGLKDRIEIFYLPPYSPELNPDELVWGHVKTGVGRKTVKSADELHQKIVGGLRSLQKTPSRVMGFFHHPSCRYAA